MADNRAKAGWYTDPQGQHELRYFDGSIWTEHVSNNQTVSESPLQTNANLSKSNTQAHASFETPDKVRKSGNKRAFIILGIFTSIVLVGVIVLFSILASELDDVSSDSNSNNAVTAKTLPVTDNQKLKNEIEKALGKSNRGIKPRVEVYGPEAGADIAIGWAINENLTQGLTKDDARVEATKILEALAKSKINYTTVLITGTFLLVDQMGNEAETNVVIGTYTKELVDKINFENFNPKNVFEIDPTAYIHPAFIY